MHLSRGSSVFLRGESAPPSFLRVVVSILETTEKAGGGQITPFILIYIYIIGHLCPKIRRNFPKKISRTAT